MKYKVIKIYIVDATNKPGAIEESNNNPDTLETVIVKPVEEKGWTKSLKSQLGF